MPSLEGQARRQPRQPAGPLHMEGQPGGDQPRHRITWITMSTEMNRSRAGQTDARYKVSRRVVSMARVEDVFDL